MRENYIKKFYTPSGKIFAEYKYNHESFTSFIKHSHETLNFISIGSGKVDIYYHDQPVQVLRAGELALFNPQQVHLTQKNSPELLEYHSLHLDTAWCKDIQEDIFKQKQEFIPIKPNILTDPTLHQHFGVILELLDGDKLDGIEYLIKALCRDIFERYCSYDRSIIIENTLLNEISGYILTNLDRALSLEEIAKKSGYSSAHINRLFKKHHGLTLHAFLVDKKLQKAKAMIATKPDASLADIAYEAGFYDQSHFIKVFKKIYSLNPTLYKNPKMPSV